MVGHYRGKIFAWDVVKEAFDELHPGTLRSTIWYDQPGIGMAEDTAASYEQPGSLEARSRDTLNVASAGPMKPTLKLCSFTTRPRRRS